MQEEAKAERSELRHDMVEARQSVTGLKCRLQTLEEGEAYLTTLQACTICCGL
jgi:hypothetical protein